MYTLCVIDMQNFFMVSRTKELVNNVKKEIYKAKKKNYPIIYVKYNLEHWTASPWAISLVKGLSAATRNYRQKYTVIKENDDGGDVLYSFLQQKGLDKTKVRVIGLNTDICVFYTVETLSQIYDIKIDVASKACLSDDPKGHRMALDKMRFMKNIRVI
jgi:nicotinamidase-related amidase